MQSVSRLWAQNRPQNRTERASHPQVGVELVQNQAHGARQVADVRRLLAQRVLEGLEVLHPLHGEAVVDDVRLPDRQSAAGMAARMEAGRRDRLTLFMTTMKGSFVL